MRSTDSFLNAHLVDAFVFHIGGRLWPIAIRDQMLRGRLVIDRALDQGFIHADRPVAVVGAGAAGVTAALRAADRGVAVTLFESDRLFARHALCRTRWVHPTQYDWLVGHWDAAFFPWAGTPDMPLQWKQPDYAYDLALDWEIQFMRHYPRLSHLLTVNLPATVTGYVPPPTLIPPGTRNLVGIDWIDAAGTPRHDDFGMVVLAMGFGEERTTVSAACPYRGFEFWSTDPFSLLSLGCPARPRVLISGGGDGGLQDFLRVTTRCRSVRASLSDLPSSLAKDSVYV